MRRWRNWYPHYLEVVAPVKGLEVRVLSCAQHYGRSMKMCPFCGHMYGGYGVAVAHELVELLVRVQLPIVTPFEN